jgi:hypothetical protein
VPSSRKYNIWRIRQDLISIIVSVVSIACVSTSFDWLLSSRHIPAIVSSKCNRCGRYVAIEYDEAVFRPLLAFVWDLSAQWKRWIVRLGLPEDLIPTGIERATGQAALLRASFGNKVLRISILYRQTIDAATRHIFELRTLQLTANV